MPSSMTHFRCARSQVPLTQQVLTCCELPRSSPSLTSRTRPTTSATAPWPSGPASTRCPDHTNATAERWPHEVVATRAQADGYGNVYGATYHDGSVYLAGYQCTPPILVPTPSSRRPSVISNLPPSPVRQGRGLRLPQRAHHDRLDRLARHQPQRRPSSARHGLVLGSGPHHGHHDPGPEIPERMGRRGH